MARWPRLTAPGIPMHITQRGNNRATTFLTEEDFGQYREFLRHASERENCTIHAYALMSNHVHLLVMPQSTTSASRLMQRLGRLYVRYFNTRYHRSGTLWEGRFKSALVETSTYYLTCSRYIDLNPVRAGLVRSPADYAWSSFACLGLGRPDPLLTLHPQYLALGDTVLQRCDAYVALCDAANTGRSRSAIRRATHGGAALGCNDFKQQLVRELRRPVTRARHGGSRRKSALVAEDEGVDMN